MLNVSENIIFNIKILSAPKIVCRMKGLISSTKLRSQFYIFTYYNVNKKYILFKEKNSKRPLKEKSRLNVYYRNQNILGTEYWYGLYPVR